MFKICKNEKMTNYLFSYKWKSNTGDSGDGHFYWWLNQLTESNISSTVKKFCKTNSKIDDLVIVNIIKLDETKGLNDLLVEKHDKSMEVVK